MKNFNSKNIIRKFVKGLMTEQTSIYRAWVFGYPAGAPNNPGGGMWGPFASFYSTYPNYTNTTATSNAIYADLGTPSQGAAVLMDGGSGWSYCM